jgi:hypothetical protein
MNNKIILPMELINHILSFRPRHPILINTCHDYSTDFEHNSFLDDIKVFNYNYMPYCDLPFYKYILDQNDVDTTYKTRRSIMMEHFKKNNVKNPKVICENYSCNCGFMANEDERYYNYRMLGQFTFRRIDFEN